MHRPDVTRGYGLLEKFLAARRYRLADDLIPGHMRSGRIVDLGCGRFPSFLIHTEFSEKIGLDKLVHSPSHHDSDYRNLQTFFFDLSADEPLPLPNESCDVVTMLAVIEHLAPGKVPPLMRDILRVLKIGGILIITTPAAWTDGLLRFMARLKLVSPEEIAEHQAVYSPSRLGELQKNAGFAEETLQNGYFECGMNCWALAARQRR